MSNAVIAHGTKLAMWDPAANAGAGAYVDLAEVNDISGPSISQGTVDVTSHDSPWREYKATIADGGEISFDINYIPSDATHQLIRGAVSDGADHQFQITFTDGSTATFNGIVTSFEIGAPVADKMSAAIKIKVTGSITFA